MSYIYPFDMAIESVLNALDFYGIPCLLYIPIETRDEMNRVKRSYGEPEDDDIVVMQPYPLGEKTFNSDAGNNNKRTLKLITDTEVKEYYRIEFFGVMYSVDKVEAQGRDCNILYQVFLTEV